MKLLALACVCGACFWSACSRSNNLFLGRVEATVGTHQVEVTDCYRMRVPPPEQTGPAEYRFTPCRDADVVIRGDRLTVNGQPYGSLTPRDSVLVDHGVVSIRRRPS